MTQIFAYIPFKNGVAEDVAMEFPEAAKKIDGGASLTAVVTGSGADLDSVANEMAKVYNEVIKIDNAALAYPNAEIVRKALVNVLPADAIILAAHDTFGMDLAPGLSVKMDSAYAADIVDIEGMERYHLETDPPGTGRRGFYPCDLRCRSRRRAHHPSGVLCSCGRWRIRFCCGQVRRCR